MITWRVPVLVLCFAVMFSAVGYFVFPRGPQQHNGTTIRLPDRKPSNASWVWPDGVPGWEGGKTIQGYPVTGVQQIELAGAQLAAARAGLDSDAVRVIVGMRGDRRGVLAILATQTLYETPERTCLAGLLRGNVPVHWLCPSKHVLSHQHVLVAAATLDWAGGVEPLYFVGVARGDVDRIVLTGGVSARQELYTRGKTWGEFEAAEGPVSHPQLLVYAHGRLVETIPLDVPAGRQRVIR